MNVWTERESYKKLRGLSNLYDSVSNVIIECYSDSQHGNSFICGYDHVESFKNKFNSSMEKIHR